jgi:hypothetical protein
LGANLFGGAFGKIEEEHQIKWVNENFSKIEKGLGNEGEKAIPVFSLVLRFFSIFLFR